MTPGDIDFNSPEWLARKAEIHAWVQEVKAREKARKAAKKARRIDKLLREPRPEPRPGPRVYPIVREAVLELLGERGPSIDPDLADAYLEHARDRDWPDVSPQTVRAARGRLTSSGLVAAAGTAVNRTTGRTVTLWGLAEATDGPPAPRAPMWGDE